MEILNTITGTEITTLSVWVALIFALAALSLAMFFGGGEHGSLSLVLTGLIGIVIVITLILLPNSIIPFSKSTGKYTPTRYEVKLTDPNFVIDAQKYKVISKRGEIITLEEVNNVEKTP